MIASNNVLGVSLQAAAAKTLSVGDYATSYGFATSYVFLTNARGAYILGYIAISDLAAASSRRRQLLQAGSRATIRIPIPAGLDAAAMEAVSFAQFRIFLAFVSFRLEQ